MDFEKRVRENYPQVQARIAEAALRSGRDPSAIRLIAVSKLFPPEALAAVWELGQRDFGENRPLPGAAKIREIAARFPELTPTWHMIGHVQSRKTKVVAEHFDWLHSLDRRKFAEQLSRLAAEAGRELPVLLECNVSGEASKYGYDLSRWQTDAGVRERFLTEVEALLTLPALHFAGLMTMAPLVDDPETVRPVFASLRALRDCLRERFPQQAWPHLSMGMTDDFEVAIAEGATLVRIGRGVFGPYPEP